MEINVLIEEGVEAEPAPMDPKKSIRKNEVICLECGKEFKQLGNRHLKEHGLDAKEYRKKYGFKARQPLAAKSLSKKRSKTAKALGLGERLQEALQKSRKAKEKPPAEKVKAKAPVKKRHTPMVRPARMPTKMILLNFTPLTTSLVSMRPRAVRRLRTSTGAKACSPGAYATATQQSSTAVRVNQTAHQDDWQP